MTISAIAVVVILGGSAVAQEPKPATNLVERFIAWQRPPLTPEVVGVLVPIRPRWAPALTATSGVLPVPGPSSYPVLGPGSWLFYSGGSEPRLPHIAPEAYKPFGDAALVRAKARPWSQYPDPRFVVTAFEILDGSESHPLVVSTALGQARARFDAHLAATQPVVEEGLAAGMKTAPIRMIGPRTYVKQEPVPSGTVDVAPFGPETDRVDEGIFPSWFEKEGELRVLLVRRVTRAQTRRQRFADERPCPPGAPCMAPRPYWTTMEKWAAMQAGYLVVFDRKGEIVSEERFGPTAVEH